MHSSKILSLTKELWNNVLSSSRNISMVKDSFIYKGFATESRNITHIFCSSRISVNISRGYAKKVSDECRKACVDIQPEADKVCPEPCERRTKKKQGILHKIKLKIVEGGTNFGSNYCFYWNFMFFFMIIKRCHNGLSFSQVKKSSLFPFWSPINLYRRIIVKLVTPLT